LTIRLLSSEFSVFGSDMLYYLSHMFIIEIYDFASFYDDDI